MLPITIFALRRHRLTELRCNSYTRLSDGVHVQFVYSKKNFLKPTAPSDPSTRTATACTASRKFG